MAKGAFRNYRKLATTVGHELIHWSHYVLPSGFSTWYKDFSIPTSQSYSEYRAHKWEQRYSGEGNPSSFEPFIQKIGSKYGFD